MFDIVNGRMFLENPGVATLAFETALLSRVLHPALVPPGGVTTKDVATHPERYAMNSMRFIRRNEPPFPSLRTLAESAFVVTQAKTVTIVVRDPIYRLAETYLQWQKHDPTNPAHRLHTFSTVVSSGVIFEKREHDTMPQTALLDGGDLLPDARKHIVFYNEENPDGTLMDVLSRLGIPSHPTDALPKEEVTAFRHVEHLRQGLSLEARSAIDDHYVADYRAWDNFSAFD